MNGVAADKEISLNCINIDIFVEISYLPNISYQACINKQLDIIQLFFETSYLIMTSFYNDKLGYRTLHEITTDWWIDHSGNTFFWNFDFLTHWLW